MSCQDCLTKVKREEGLQCTGGCQQMYHFSCASKYSSGKPDPKTWLCNACTPSGSTEFLLKNFQEIKDQLKSLQVNYVNLSSKLDAITALQDKVHDLELKNKLLQQSVDQKDSCISDLQKRLSNIEQYSRRLSFEIRDVQPTANESVESVVLKLADKLDVPLSSHEIQAAHRIPSVSGKTPAIIVSLMSRKKRDLIVASKKVVTNLELTGAGSGRVWVGDSLSPYFKKLLWSARMKAKQCGYKFIWWRNGVLVRKNENSTILKIENEADLSLII